MEKSNLTKTTILAAIIGATIGALLTFLLPILFNYITSDKRTIIESTPVELISWYNKINNDYQAQQLAKKLYYDKHIRYSGHIESLENFPYGKISFRINEVSAWFDEDSSASILNKGDEIDFIGEIRDISKNTVILDNCKLINRNTHNKNEETQ